MIIKFEGQSSGDIVSIEVKNDTREDWRMAHCEAVYQLCEEVEEVEEDQ